jgi:tetratricopeptide (TPR) repeat protein
MLAMQRRHDTEAMALYAHALQLGLDNDLPTATVRAHFNLADLLCHRDLYREALAHYRSALGLTRKIGDRSYERSTLGELAFTLGRIGEWDEAAEFAGAIAEDEVRSAPADVLSLLAFGETYVELGQTAEFEKLMSWSTQLVSSDDWQARSCYLACRACLRRGQGRDAEALADADEAINVALELGGAGHQNVKAGFRVACESALALKDLAKVDELVGVVDALGPGERPPYLRAQALRFRARLADSRGNPDAVEPFFVAAEEAFAQLGMPFWLAVTQLEHAEWLVANGRGVNARPMLAGAVATFERLKALPWLDRATESAPAVGVLS